MLFPHKETDLKRLVIGTRRSKLALIQTRIVSEAIASAFPGLSIVLKEITTAGDRSPETPLSDAGSVGFFTRDIETKLLAGEIDLAVHSLKDLPVEQPEGLMIAATPKRGDPRDALLCREAKGLSGLPQGAVVGTSSPRRSAQLLARRRDLAIRELRGNVDTRIEKLRRGDYDAIVAAKAALDRLGRADAITEMLEPDWFLPAPGQGALALETREGDLDAMRIASALNDAVTFIITSAERGLLARLGGGCRLPLGALAEAVAGGGLLLRAALVSPDGLQSVRAECRGMLDNPVAVVNECYDELMSRGAEGLIR
jgi:hydroxymethylbilane synthase